MVYGNFKDLARRTSSDKVLRDKAFNIAKNIANHDGYKIGLASMIYKVFDKKYASFTGKSTKGGSVNNVIKQNEQLAEELHKLIIKILKKTRVYSSFKDNIWVVI